MKKIYSKFLRFLQRLPIKIEILKTYIAEWRAIFKKAPLYKGVKWTKEQQREFDAFWKKNYGKKISNRWHRLYEACNGVHRIDYVPEMIYSTKIEPRMNDYNYCSVFADKNLLGLLFDGRLEGVRTPECYLFNSFGNFYDGNRNLISKKSAIEIFGRVGVAVIKPTVNSSSGKNVMIVDMQDGIDERSGQSAESIIEKLGCNFNVQEKIEPHKEMSAIYSKSINTFRVISYICEDSIEVAPISLRIGGGGSEVDNIHAGGMSISITPDGRLGKRAYRLGYGNSFENFEIHPDTGIKFDGYRFSFAEKLIAAAKHLHKMTANIGVISWDLTVDSNCNIVVIEANLIGQSVWFPQMLSGEAIFGENTPMVLKNCKKMTKRG